MANDADKDITNESSIDHWKMSWVENSIPFHLLEVHPSLGRHVDKLTKGRDNLTIFFPLCGKAVDMRWLAEKGHKVIGVEISDVAIKTFFKEANLEFTESDIKDGEGKLFMSKDENIKLFQCDMFKYKREFGGMVDAIWDRGALEAIDVDQREFYLKLMLSILKLDGVYLLHCFEFPDGAFETGPHEIKQNEIVEMFGPKCSVDKLEDYMLSQAQLEFHGIDQDTKIQGNVYRIVQK
ncbi:probable thiopurine S-methyltransferase [Antedon mediterranea]|uniref:probable thiopurine S-methyltransferase n=1 Tax=Antedon mediterranea TaxID=105859 RepID=UPI003AF6F98B